MTRGWEPVRPAPGALFDASSLTWATAARWWVLWGGQRALLLQVAHPSVAAGVAQHSDFRRNPFGRLRRTLEAMLTVSFGSPASRRATLDRLDRIHAGVSGDTAAGHHYEGSDPDLAAWVFATLVDSLMEVERRYVGRFDDADRRTWYAESRVMGREFGVADLLPDSLDGFTSWWDGAVGGLAPDEVSREVAESVIRPAAGPVPEGWWKPVSAIALDLLPPVVREGLRLPALMPGEVARVQWAERFSRRMARLPAALTLNPLVVPAVRGGGG